MVALTLRSSAGGYSLEDAQMRSCYNRIWTVVCNQAISMDCRIAASIPIAQFQCTRVILDVPIEMLTPVDAKYVPTELVGAQPQATARWLLLYPLTCGVSPVDSERLPGNEGGRIGCQEGNRSGDFRSVA